MKSLHSKENWGLFLLRFGLGVVFVVHGYDKITNMSGTAGFIESLGFPAPIVFAVLLTAIELLAGIALIVGFFARIAATLIAVVMVTAIIMVKGTQGFLGAAELDFMLLFSALAIILLGPGGLRLRFTALKNGSERSQMNAAPGSTDMGSREGRKI